MRRYDYLVIGSGIAGASIACELGDSASVLVVEREASHGYHTTGRSAAMFIESYGNGWIRRLTGASRAFFDAPSDGFCDHPLLRRRGCLNIATRDQLPALDALAADIVGEGSEMREIRGPAARAMVPILRPEAVSRAVFEPNSCDIDTHGLHAGYLRLARARGADLQLDAGVERIEHRTAGWRVALAGGDTVEARVIVNAAGAWADAVAELAGVRPVGLEPRRRTAVLIDPPAELAIEAWPTVIDVAEQFYFKPESGRLLACPADETPSAPVDAAPEELDIAVCIDRLHTATTLSISHIRRSWAGLRTFAPDRTPVFGYDLDVAGFFWFAGQGGYGMQTAPAAARLGAALALGREIPSDLAERGLWPAPFSPSRWR
ncbi:MAG: FAD-dependent oxidoreductase [Brevundimonas sp.]|uniref:NAD(P)/FAD-dependent oxidoreductase n=1 Tax=Brevundimonas sp. TaxID=1871086 RepID=UPI002727A157|nr:FAD-dependent oxidoreductase [Brevundimonas sp.]MDO9077064.1 FAD-dependent oxidoreductase [Brevundimonas sp.]MDP3079405.1 FAD-dependent oxidoreductase [Brevundimonas sp.]MDZ4060646.1 FAD-dependent oxidoreductase [Brevundimonas sp.]